MYYELIKVLSGLGYTEQQGAGSRVVFFNEQLKHNIKLHKPHPVNDFTLKLTWNEAKKAKDEIINLPEVIANKRGIKIVVFGVTPIILPIPFDSWAGPGFQAYNK